MIFPASENASVVTAARTPVEECEWTEFIGEFDIGDYAVIALCEGRGGKRKLLWVLSLFFDEYENKKVVSVDSTAWIYLTT